MKNSNFPIIASILLFAMLLSTCHGKPQYWNSTHERCHTFGNSSLETRHCPTNMIAVSAGSFNHFMCDCPPYTIYSPDTNSCHEAYTRGPCPEQHYVHIGFDETEPSCMKNPCEEEGQILFKGSCHKLGDTQPCPEGQYLNIDLNSLQLECRYLKGKQNDALNNYKYWCARGSVSVKCGKCKRVVG